MRPQHVAQGATAPVTGNRELLQFAHSGSRHSVFALTHSHLAD